MSKFAISAITENKCYGSKGERATLISALNSKAKAELDLPDNFVRPRWS